MAMAAIFDYVHLDRLAAIHRNGFATEKPFPNVELADFINHKTLENILSEFPDYRSSYWKQPENIHQRGCQVADLTNTRFKIDTFGPFCKLFYHELNSAPFLNFLEKLTSISGLVGDPYLVGAGFHNCLPGSYLDIHADFSRHDHLHLERRLNFLLYLNVEWKDNYGGQLVLHNPELEPIKSIAPIAKKLFIFETTNTSYHGFSVSDQCPKGVTRKVLTAYYYTKERSGHLQTTRHDDIYPEDPNFSVEYATRGV